MSEQNPEDGGSEAARARRPDQLPAAARRALAEAAARRGRQSASVKPAETGGPQGPEPTRFGDWERKGIASDF